MFYIRESFLQIGMFNQPLTLQQTVGFAELHYLVQFLTNSVQEHLRQLWFLFDTSFVTPAVVKCAPSHLTYFAMRDQYFLG